MMPHHDRGFDLMFVALLAGFNICAIVGFLTILSAAAWLIFRVLP